MSLVITKGFGIDIEAFYKCPFTVTITDSDALEGVLVSSDSLIGCLIGSDAICGTLIASDTMTGILDDDTLTGTVGCA